LALEKLGDRTFLLKGSPATIIYDDDRTLYIVDPGHGRKRAKQLRKIIQSFNPTSVDMIITHYHSDHYSSAISEIPNTRIVATRLDAPMIENPEYRLVATFGYPFSNKDPLLLYPAEPLSVKVKVEPDSNLGPLKLIHLPGHTLGQVGVLTPDRVLYAADALFGEKVLEAYGVPYHYKPCTAKNSLTELLRKRDLVDIVVPGHGPRVDSVGLEKLVQLNIDAIEGVEEGVIELLESRPSSTLEISKYVLERRGLFPSPSLVLLVESTIRGYIACMRDFLEPIVYERIVRWRVTRR